MRCSTEFPGLLANLRQVTSDLAHDLRTPLARLRHQLERLRADTETPEQSNAVESAVDRADEVLTLFDAILRISELEEGSLRRSFAQLDLGALVAEIVESHLALAEDAGKSLAALIDDGECVIQGDRELIAQALINLIENALRHTHDNALITVGTQRKSDTITLFVRDEGPGIAAVDRARVLERFVRLETSRSTPGHGLGLSLVKAVATAHGATLNLGNANPGLCAALIFPRTIAG